jgi:hypothetical protein
MSVELQMLDLLRHRLRDLHHRSAEALGQLSEADVNWRPHEESNSIANLVLHLAGNLHQRLAVQVGGAADTRDRDAEFNAREAYSREQLVAILGDAVREADKVIGGLTPDRLGEPLRIRDRPVTMLQHLTAAVTHFAEHAGQILYIAKLRLGPAYRVISR